MTAKDDIESKRKGFRAGIDDYLVKPIDLDELSLRIEALLRRAKIASKKKLVINVNGTGSCKLDYFKFYK